MFTDLQKQFKYLERGYYAAEKLPAYFRFIIDIRFIVFIQRFRIFPCRMDCPGNCIYGSGGLVDTDCALCLDSEQARPHTCIFWNAKEELGHLSFHYLFWTLDFLVGLLASFLV